MLRKLGIPNGKITGPNISYLIENKSCIIGREVGAKVDLVIDISPCVSRQHLKILAKNDELYLVCLGRNGIFINECFHGYDLREIRLPHISNIRFPSTDVILKIESRSGLMERSLKNYPLKKRVVLSSKSSKEMEVEEPYLSESSKENADSSTKIIQDTVVPIVPEIDRLSPMDHGTETTKPPYSYAQLIIQAIVSCENKQMTLSEIYRYISKNFPYYKINQKGWQNSIRHNLSLNRYFIRVPRSQNSCGKSAYWRLDKTQEAYLTGQAFWKRKSKNFSMFNRKSKSAFLTERLSDSEMLQDHSDNRIPYSEKQFPDEGSLSFDRCINEYYDGVEKIYNNSQIPLRAASIQGDKLPNILI